MILGIGVDILHLPRVIVLVKKLAVPSARSLAHDVVGGNGHRRPETSTAIVGSGMNRIAQRILSAEEMAEWQLKSARDDWKLTLGLTVHEFEGKTAAGRQALYSGPVQYLTTRWTAKEAAHKAISPHAVLTWKDCRVAHLSPPDHLPFLSTKPILLPTRSIVPEPGDLETLPVVLPRECCRDNVTVTIEAAHLTVSHDGDYVVSQVLFEGTLQ